MYGGAELALGQGARAHFAASCSTDHAGHLARVGGTRLGGSGPVLFCELLLGSHLAVSAPAAPRELASESRLLPAAGFFRMACCRGNQPGLTGPELSIAGAEARDSCGENTPTAAPIDG